MRLRVLKILKIHQEVLSETRKGCGL